MSQVNSVKDLRNKHAKCLVQNRGQTPLVDIKGSSYPRPRTTLFALVTEKFLGQSKKLSCKFTNIQM